MAFRNIKLHNYNFKYTTSEERIVWCKNIYNGLSVLISTIKNIRWEEYEFDNECEYEYLYLKDQEDDNIYSSLDVKRMHTKPESRLSYQIFGGASYEILNKTNYSLVNLRDFMDPTGDVDIRIYIPMLYNDEISNNKKIYDVHLPLLESNGKMHTYLSTTIDWCFNQFLEQLNMHDLSALFPNSIPFDIAEYSEIPIESRVSDLCFKDVIIPNSHCHLVSFYAPKMNLFKIQFVIKISDSNVVILDHLIELIFMNFSNTSTYENKKYIPDIIHYENLSSVRRKVTGHCEYLQRNKVNCDIDYNIDALDTLLNDNFRAYEHRQAIFKHDIQSLYHKSINHIARIIYLLELVIKKYKIYKSSFKSMIQSNFSNKDFIKSLLAGYQIFERKELINGLVDKIINFSKEENDIIYKNLHLYFYKIDNNYKVKISKIRVSDFLSIYLTKLSPSSLISFSFAGHTIKGEPDDKKYDLFIKKIKQNVTTARTRKFIRKEKVSSVKSDGEHKSREQNSDDLHDFKGIDNDEPEFFSLESSKKDNVFGLGLKKTKKNKSKKYKSKK